MAEQIKYTQIERLKGIKDKIEVGVTLPVIERQKEATLTIKKKPLIIIQKNTKKDIVAIKLKPINPVFGALGANATTTDFVQFFPRTLTNCPLNWQWQVIKHKLRTNQEINNSHNVVMLYDKQKRKIVYTQNLDFFKKEKYVTTPTSNGFYLVGYLSKAKATLYVDPIFREVVASRKYTVGTLSDKLADILSGNKILSYKQDPLFKLVDWDYKNKIFAIQIEGDWIRFKFNISTTISLINGETDWIPIAIVS